MLVSGSVEVFEGARAAVLHLDGLFRLDVVVVPDSLRLIVRNLSGAEILFEPDGYPRPVIVQGDDLGELALSPGHHQVAFRLGDPGAEAAVQVNVTLATLRATDQGTVHVTGQGIVRRAEPFE